MPCYRPIRAWRSQHLNESGKRGLVFKQKDAHAVDLPLDIPCGQCVGCRLERSRQWAIRCIHEASLYDDNCFITLTYDPEHLPKDQSLKVEHFQLFMKRFRKKYPNKKIRFFHCGEYGENTGRPHYHACIFNHDFEDKKRYKDVNGNRLYTSETLETLWALGFCTVGALNFETAAYVARYIMKKVTGDKAEQHYQGRKPEYTTMSRNPGLGKPWLDKWKTDVYPHDYVIVNGKKVGVPKFYDQQLDDLELLTLKRERRYKSYDYRENNTSRRLYDREKVTTSRTTLLKRNFDK